MALGRVVPARRAIAASSAREGEKARNVQPWTVVCFKSLEKLILDVFLVVDHDYFDLEKGVNSSYLVTSFFTYPLLLT